MSELAATDPAVYENAQTAWREVTENGDLRNMDQLLTAATIADLRPTLDYLGGDRPLSLLDIGVGIGTTTEEICEGRDINYYALDANELLLDMRTTPRSHMLIAKSSELPVQDGSFDITYSRVTTAWNVKPEQAIAEQLRATRIGGVALFTEFDWNHAGVSPESDAIEACMGLCAITKLALASAGFKPTYGAELGAAIDNVVAGQDREDVSYARQEARHELPEGDYRELLLETGGNILSQLKLIGRGKAKLLADMLESYMATIEKAKRCIIRPPALVTEVVTVEAVD